MYTLKDFTTGMVVNLKSAEEIMRWNGHGGIPCDVYGNKDVVISGVYSSDFSAHCRTEDRARSSNWRWIPPLVNEIVTDKERIKEAYKACGRTPNFCPICGKLMRPCDRICNDCAKDHFICSKCGEPHPITDCVSIGTKRFCASCFNEEVNAEKIVKLGNGTYALSRDCACVNGEYVDISRYDGINDYHDMKEAGNYHFFKTEEDGRSPLYLGVELEVENSDEDRDENNDARIVKAYLGADFVEHEEDGSLDNGFENITHPATFAYHKQIADKYKVAFDFLRRNGYTSHQNGDCGLHIHFNRNFFGREEEERVSKLLYLTEKFWNEMVIFSRRSENQLNRWAKRYDEAHDAVCKHLKDGYYGRYHAINLVNSKTIEFRLFRGTLNLETFYATLELVDRLVRLAKDSTIENLKTLTWDDILNTDTLKNYYNRVVLRKQR